LQRRQFSNRQTETEQAKRRTLLPLLLLQLLPTVTALAAATTAAVLATGAADAAANTMSLPLLVLRYFILWLFAHCNVLSYHELKYLHSFVLHSFIQHPIQDSTQVLLF